MSYVEIGRVITEYPMPSQEQTLQNEQGINTEQLRETSLHDQCSNFQNLGTLNVSDSDLKNLDNGKGVYFRKQRKISNISGTQYQLNRSSSRLNDVNRRISYQPSIGESQFSILEIDQNIPPPSTDTEKSKMTRKYIAIIFGLCYAIFLITFSTIIFVANAVEKLYPIPESYCIGLLLIGSLYFIYLYIDIRVHVIKSNKIIKEREKRQKIFDEQQQSIADFIHQIGQNESMEQLYKNRVNGSNYNFQFPMQNITSLPDLKPVSHRYCFATGRHGEFFYLKLGAAWFCLGLLIHQVLIITYQIIFLTSNDPQYKNCASIITLVFDILFPLYSIFLLFFMFKYANIIINEGRGLARFALMHAIGTSLSFWVYTIVRETSDAIQLKDYDKNNGEYPDTRVMFMFKSESYLSPDCLKLSSMNVVFKNIAPYLYPFIIEFYILIVGVFYMMYANINQCPKRVSAPAHDQSNNLSEADITFPDPEYIPNEHNIHNQLTRPAGSTNVSEYHCPTSIDHENQYKTNLVIYADCHSASRGLFIGLILIVLTVVFIILFFIAVSDDESIDLDDGMITNKIFELVVLIILIISVILAYLQTAKLDINYHSASQLDNILLFIAIPALFMETIFSMVPAVINGSGFNIAVIICQLIQILIQTSFIIDGLRRCSNDPTFKKHKPGKELITFLTIANVSLWMFYTFSVKNEYTGDERYKFYGDELWSILNHLSLPLIMFYRFHSSVCLVDIWRHAYEPGSH